MVLDHGQLLFEGFLDTLKASLFKYEPNMDLDQSNHRLWAGRFD